MRLPDRAVSRVTNLSIHSNESAMKRVTQLICLAACTAAMAQTTYAGSVSTIDCNVDLYNLTGYTANDFDYIIAGLVETDVKKLYSGPLNKFTDAEVKPWPDATNQSGILVHFFGAEVPDGEGVHVGYEVGVHGLQGVAAVDAYWSWNGAKLGSPSVLCGGLQNTYREAQITNSGQSTVWVQRRALYQEAIVDLDDLYRGGSVWDDASLVDSMLIELEAGESLLHTFGETDHGSYILVTDVFLDSAGNTRQSTVFTSVNYTPEPSMVGLLGAGLLGLLWMRRRPLRGI